MTRQSTLWALISMAIFSHGCERCDELDAFQPGDYTIIGLELGAPPRPGDEWIVETVTGAHLSVDRENGEAIIRYSRDGATYEVHYELKSF